MGATPLGALRCGILLSFWAAARSRRLSGQTTPRTASPPGEALCRAAGCCGPLGVWVLPDASHLCSRSPKPTSQEPAHSMAAACVLTGQQLLVYPSTRLCTHPSHEHIFYLRPQDKSRLLCIDLGSFWSR